MASAWDLDWLIYLQMYACSRWFAADDKLWLPMLTPRSMLSQGKDLKDDKVNAGAIKVKKNRLARQYMNRRGGFNRPLPAERTGEKVSHRDCQNVPCIPCRRINWARSTVSLRQFSLRDLHLVPPALGLLLNASAFGGQSSVCQECSRAL